MSLAGRPVLFLIALLALTPVACGGEPPEKERQQAQGAIDAARAAGAEQYAREEFTAAQVALKHSTEAVEERDYRLALNHALDSRERAQNAAKMAADGKALARVDADRAISGAADLLKSVRAAIATAEGSRGSARALSVHRAAFVAAERQVQEARAAYDQQDYPRATSSARAATEPITAILKDLQAPPPPPARRRR